ncbi:phage protein Gp37 [Rhodospirillum sp. A1_3_36]|uniref:phage protein Gp37 n=1 Tax=Rhodospirillum sp. A1_3_36 TaxID=3391666 RepID=UPI0039A6551B
MTEIQADIDTIEQAILDRLIAAAAPSGPWGYRMPTIDSYGAELEGNPELSMARGQAPAIWVVFGGEESPDRQGFRRLRYSIVVLARSYRNERASRRGDGTTPGAYQILKDVRAVLAKDDLGGLLVRGLEHIRTRSLASGKAVKVYAFDVEAKIEDEAAHDTIDPEALADFRRFRADWDIPPHGNVQPPLPAAEADYRTDLTLPTDEEA